MQTIVKDNAIFEGDIIYKDDHVICECGNDKFKMGAHLDMQDKAVTSYSCDKCGRIVNVTVKREFPW